MAPRKKSKPSSSSSSHGKKSNHNNNNNSNQCSQPSKFGIQHFFERHTQNAAASAASNPSQIPPPPNASTSDPPPPNHSQTTPSPPVTIPAVPTIAAGADCGAIVAVAAGKDNDDRLDASPEVYSKSVSVKRFKFSPGMLIKQSQDDGGEEVTWRISPVNERLQAVSKRLPDVIRVLADASKMKASSFRPCSMKESSPSSMEKLEKWLSSPALKPPERSLALLKRAGSREEGLDQEAEVRTSNSGGNIVNNGRVPMQGSPFQTPPSISYCPDEPANATTKEGLDGLSSRTHRKALLELLDQVEDVISVEESVDNNPETHTFKAKDTKPICKPCDSKSLMTTPMVSEKQRTADQSCDQHPIKVLRLLNEQSGRECSLYLYDAWFYSVVEPGDTINVIGEFDDQGKCVVDNDNNLLIVHPDLLVSGTRVASSFSCPRRSVLDERLKCKEHSTAALIGTILHQIFQAGLIREHPTKEHLEEYARVVLRKNVESMYACGVKDNDVHTTLVEAIPKILNWLKCFKDSQECKAPAVDFGSMYEQENLSITEVMDIEEMAWAPNYGLKGVIDASIQAKMQSHTNKTTEKIMPLEFKTGKATSGQSFMEHRAQVVLYTLLMSERYLKHIDSGLLYYLHTDQTQGISVQRSDIVGLIMRRNELANDIRKASTTQRLPPMLQNLSVCKGCRHLNICTIYHKAHGGHSDSSGLGMLFDSHVEHLSHAHYDFLRHWDRLIDLEAKETKIVKKDLWLSHSENELSTNSLSSLILDVSDKSLPYNKSPKDGRFIYHFLRQDLPRHDHDTLNRDSVNGVPSWMSNQDCALKSGDYVVLRSEAGHFALASGIIADINRLHVSVSFSRRLRLPGGRPASETGDLLHQLWRIDKDEFKTSYAVMRFNLIQLFVQSSQSSHLRKMIVDLEPPRFDRGIVFSQDPAVSYIRSERSLNNDQRRAIHKILTAKDYVLILGMPGTGKTSTMVHAVKALLMRGVSILLTSYTNSAVDNLLIKLKSQGIDFVRIGRHEAVHEEIHDHCFSGADRCTVEDIKVRLEKVKVVAVTCLGITHPLLAKKRFDICIMDEAGQTTLPVSLGPLMFASTFVLVGDHYQLPPLVQSAEARENGMGISLFRRLSEAHPEAISALQCQYRMCAGIMELSNALIYGNRLRCGSSEIANAKLNFRNTNCTTPWLNEVLDANRSVVLINTDVLPALEVKEHQTVNNPTEAYIVSEITNELLKRGIVREEIGIITPYNSQANLIRRLVGGTNVEAHTIDKYQGRDKDCILVSFVRSTENPRSFSSSLLGDWHRINVALTRAKKKLIMVGSSGTLSKVPLLKLLIDKVEEQHGLLSISRKDFGHLGELKRCSLLH